MPVPIILLIHTGSEARLYRMVEGGTYLIEVLHLDSLPVEPTTYIIQSRGETFLIEHLGEQGEWRAELTSENINFAGWFGNLESFDSAKKEFTSCSWLQKLYPVLEEICSSES